MTARNPKVCSYCNLKHDRVEAGGMWHCPNPYCFGPGNAYFRSKLKSFVENSDGTHSVKDTGEWFTAALNATGEFPGLAQQILKDCKDNLKQWDAFLRSEKDVSFHFEDLSKIKERVENFKLT